MIFYDEKGLRMVSPWEMLATLAFDKHTVLPRDVKAAWRAAGNALSPIHAFLQLYKTHVLLGELSPFSCKAEAIQIVKNILDCAIHLSHHETQADANMWFLIPVQGQDDNSSKKRKCDDEIPPTVPFDIEDDEVLSTKMLKISPVFKWEDDPRFGDCSTNPQGSGVISLQHVERHWNMFIDQDSGANVQSIVMRGLPHAKAEHFRGFTLDGEAVTWDSIIAIGGLKTMVFEPVYSLIQCDEQSLGISLNLRIDVTWKVKTASAFIATSVGCGPESVSMLHNGLCLEQDTFLMQYEPCAMSFKFKACLPGYVSWEKKDDVVQRVVNDHGVLPAGNQHVRWVARHPCKKVIRTAAADGSCKISDMVALLFPDVQTTVGWKVYHGDEMIDAASPVNMFEQLSIQWDSFRPLPVTVFRKSMITAAVDSPFVQSSVGSEVKRYVRSPLKIRADELKLPKGVQVADVGASYFASSQMCLSMICQHGCTILDPETTVDQTIDSAVLSFRVCPLLGGAKNDGIKQRLKTMLVAKGVPEDVVGTRVQNFFGKASPDELAYVLKNVQQVGRDELTEALQKLGWNASAIRPQGVNRWIIAAKDDPPCSHLVLNGAIATVDHIHKRTEKNLTIITKEYKVDTMVDSQNQVVAVSASSRYAEMRAHVESQIASAVDQRLAHANSRIEELSSALESMKSEQEFTKQKLTEVEASVTNSSQAIITQMGAMLREFESRMTQAVSTITKEGVHDSEKRARLEEVPVCKHDPDRKSVV